MKELLFGTSAREKILAGAKKLTDAVKMTMGPNGRNVLIRGNLEHVVVKTGKSVLKRDSIVTKDGATVAKEVVLKDPFEDTGAQTTRTTSRQERRECRPKKNLNL